MGRTTLRYLVHPYNEKTEGGILLHTWYNMPMKTDNRYTVFVMQSGVDAKDVYVAQTSEDPTKVIARYNAVENPKTLPKPLGSMLPLMLRPDLAGDDNIFASEKDAIEYRKVLSESIEKQSYRYNLKSKRSFYFGRKKSIKNKQTGEYTLVLDPSMMKDGDRRGGNVDSEAKDAFSYGRKKSCEWNDEAASKLEASIKDKMRRKHEE